MATVIVHTKTHCPHGNCQCPHGNTTHTQQYSSQQLTSHILQSPIKSNKSQYWLKNLKTEVTAQKQEYSPQSLIFDFNTLSSDYGQKHKIVWQPLMNTRLFLGQGRHRTHKPTYGNIWWTVGLQELVDVSPHFGNPVNGAIQIVVSDACADLCFHQLPSQVASKETLHGLHVIGAQHPAEVVVQL